MCGFFSLLQKNVLDRRRCDTCEQLRIAIEKFKTYGSAAAYLADIGLTGSFWTGTDHWRPVAARRR